MATKPDDPPTTAAEPLHRCRICGHYAHGVGSRFLAVPCFAGGCRCPEGSDVPVCFVMTPHGHSSLDDPIICLLRGDNDA